MPESTIVRPSPAEARRSVIAAWKDPIAADFRLYVRECSNAALYDLAEGLWWAIEHPGTNPETDPALRHLVDRGREENLRLCQAEIERRRRLVALGRKLPKIFTPRFNRMRAVCQQIREEVELEDLILNAGMPIKLGEKESHAPCLLCGGTDRFVIFRAPNSRGWCRQCGVQLDVIAFAMALWRCRFADAVEQIAKRFLSIDLDAQEAK